MPKRGENIHKRKDGRWEGRYIISYNLEGKASYKSVYGATYQEVKQKLKQQQDSAAKQQAVTGTASFGSLCLEWLKQARIAVKESSYADYYDKVHNHIIPQLGRLRAKTIGVEMVNQFIREKTEHGRLDGKGGLSAKTGHDIVCVLVQIIRYGETEHKIPPFQEERLILPPIQEKELPVLTEGEQKQFEVFLSSKPNLETLGLYLVLYSGLRIGELCALTWKDIDTEAGLLHVNKTLQRIKNVDGNSPFKTKVIIDTPKSKKSVRTIPLAEPLLLQLREQKVQYQPEAFFLTGKVRKFMEPRVYAEKFKRYLEASRVDTINFHALRHTFATRAEEKDFDIKSLSEVLGHASVKFTLERYVHSSAKLKKQGMEKLASSY